ncbi:ATP-binding protein [uncultured Treponema sp.]|uniref:ATP-binding protein n=1 Tax=uncultured Treponema sp. TaxID=162155 RepID=UPI00261254D7|nr:ATP-binding protein [uncultured Treponema sp.]
MEFKCITISNFLSYYDKNEIEFSPATTIFIGQNKSGKSKLFDAINFVLYNRIFLTDEGENGEWITNDKQIAPLILNNHKKSEALKHNDSAIQVYVELIINNVTSDLTISRRFDYRLTENGYEYVTQTFSITETDFAGNLISSDVGDAAKGKLRIYFAESIKNFFLFQGEAASKIMKLQKGGNFSLAVKEIARLGIFDEAKELADYYASNVNNRITRKTNKSARQKIEQEDLLRNIETKEDNIKNYEGKCNEAEKNISDYSAKLDDLNKELEGYTEFEKYFTQKKQLEQNLRQIENDLKFANTEKSCIAEESVFYKVREKIESFKDFYSKLEAKGEVPPSISAAEIKKALKFCQCTICGTSLAEGTEARKYAESRLPKCDTDRLGDYLRDLNTTMSNISEEVEKIPENLAELIKRKLQLDEKQKSLKKQKEEIMDILSQIQLDDLSSKEKKERVEKIKSSIREYSDLLDKAKSDKAGSEALYKQFNKEVSDLKHKLNTMIIDDEDIDETDRIRHFYADKLSMAMTKLSELANKTAYDEVQKKSDEYYEEMTKENSALSGSIKIDTDTSEIYTVDEQGARIRNINQGDRISIQLAVIAGILTVAENQFNQQYPFVTDAPVSALGGDNKLSTIQTMITAFGQSVIIIKDDTSSKNKTNDELRNLIANSKDVGIAYELSMSEASNTNDQFTVVTKIKG